jgi:hypothetical protein
MAAQAPVQQVDLYQVMAANRIGPPPIVIHAIVRPNKSETVEGVQASATRGESYVLLSALPQELRERVKLAIQVLIAAG